MTYMPPPKNLSFLERLGLQKQDESAEGETAQKFYNRSRFADTLARVARSANNLSFEPDANFSARKTSEIAGRKDKRASNETAKFLASKGREDLAKAILAGSITGKQAFAQYKQEEATEKARKASYQDQLGLIAERARNRAPTAFEQRRQFIKNNAEAMGLTEGTQEYADALLYGTRPPAAKAPVQRPMRQDANGRLRYTDGMKELVYKDLKVDPETVTVGGILYEAKVDDDGTTSYEAVVTPDEKPNNPNINNFIATERIIVDNVRYEKGDTLSIDVNDTDQLNAVINKAIKVNPSQTVTNITDGTDLENLSNLTGEAIQGADSGDIISPIDIPQAAGGDIAGVFNDLANYGVGLFGGRTQVSPDRQTQKANLAALKTIVSPGLIRAISATGAVKTQKEIDKILPSSGDQNAQMTAKLNALIPVLTQKLKEAIGVMQNPEDVTKSQVTIASGIKSNYPSIIKTLQDTIANAEEISGGVGTSDIEAQADAILGAD